MNNQEEVKECFNSEPATQKGSRNLIFNNCTVIINEEGKAVEVLQAKQRVEEKMKEVMSNVVSSMTKMAESYMEERKNKPTPAPQPTSPKKPSVKKPVAKKQAAKKSNKKK